MAITVIILMLNTCYQFYVSKQVLKSFVVTMRLWRSLIPFEVKVSWTKEQQHSQLEHSIEIEGAKNYALTVTTPVAFG